MRIHNDHEAASSAAALDAAAYTVGTHIVLGRGAGDITTRRGRQLLAHELAHVERSADDARTDAIPIGSVDDSAERNADHRAQQVLASAGARDVSLPHPVVPYAGRGVLRRQSLGERARNIANRVRDAVSPRTRQFISDLVASVRESPSHVGEFLTGELWDAIREHWVSIVAVTLGLLAAEGIIGALGVAPTGVTQIIAAILEVIVVAVLGYFAAVELVGVAEEGQRWWTLAREANGDARAISEASRAFVRMVWHIGMAVLAVAGVRARIRAGAVPRVTAPLRSAPPPASPPTPVVRPPLRSIRGGNPEPVQMRGGRVVSRPTRGPGAGPRAGAQAATDGSAARALQPEPVAAEPALRPVADAPPEPAAVTTPNAATPPGVQPGPAVGAGVAVATETDDRRRQNRPYPILWPAVFGPPALFDAPIRFFRRTPQAERDMDYAIEVRRELWARHRGGDPDLMPSDYHAHHIVPLFLGGLEGARGNIMFLPGRVHLRGHALLADQPQMETPPPPLRPLPRNILNPAHIGVTYELVGFK